MKRLNPETNLPFKQGDIRADGYVFQTYAKTKIKQNGEFTEIWLSPKVFERQLEKAIENNKRWYEKNAERHRENYSHWSKTNLDKKAAYSAKRRSAKLQRTPKWLTKEQLIEIETMYAKAKEMQTLTGVEHHVDHIVPLQGDNVSGLHVPWNLQVISAIENVKKGNKWR
jgi:5-methylcytosine-specific restriction endonuclease McrA